jgi:dienelactone hydrolase
MPSEPPWDVITSHEYLQRLLMKAPDRRFTGSSPDEFSAWRGGFIAWLRRLLYAEGGGAGSPGVPEFVVSGQEEWHGCKRTELRFRNPAFDLVVPATVLEPPPAKHNGAGILCQHGHGAFGRLPVIGAQESPEMAKDLARYRYDFGCRMAQAGYVVIAIDLLNFGSRAMPKAGGRDTCDMVGLWLGVLGLNAVGLQVSDIRHAISILAQWDGVDAERIGMCGLSQGGRMTMYTTALDERIKVAVPSGSGNTCQDRIGLGSGLCGVQTVPGLMPHADHPDVFASIAPRPMQLQWGSADGLIIQEQAEAGIEQIGRCYAAAGCPDYFQVDRFQGGHVFHMESALAWFAKWL